MTIEFSIFISTLIPLIFFLLRKQFFFASCFISLIVYIFFLFVSLDFYLFVISTSLFVILFYFVRIGIYAPRTNQFIGSSFWFHILYIHVRHCCCCCSSCCCYYYYYFFVCAATVADWCVHHNSIPIWEWERTIAAVAATTTVRHSSIFV